MLVRRTWISSCVLALAAFTLAQAPQPAPPPQPCEIGTSWGMWDLPDLGQNGALDGYLYMGANLPVYHFVATLIDVPSPCLSCIEGDLQGTLDDGVGPAPDFVVRGHYRGAFFAGAGRFTARVFPPNQNVPVGDLEGKFLDRPSGVPQTGGFRGTWLICH